LILGGPGNGASLGWTITSSSLTAGNLQMGMTDFTDEVIIRKFHDYKWGRYRVLIQHFDKKPNEVMFKKEEKN
jgi:hypothetical protein